MELVERQLKCVNNVEDIGASDRCSPCQPRPAAPSRHKGASWSTGVVVGGLQAHGGLAVEAPEVARVLSSMVESCGGLGSAAPPGTLLSVTHSWCEPHGPVLWCCAVHGCTAVATVERSGGRRSRVEVS